MSFDSVNAIQSGQPTRATHTPTAPTREMEAARRVAAQFEALLLTQLTASLNGTENSGGDGEESLFGNETGSGLYRQLFSEQIATSIAQSGGVGLSDVLIGQLSLKRGAHKDGGATSSNVNSIADMLKQIRSAESSDSSSSSSDTLKNTPAANTPAANTPAANEFSAPASLTVSAPASPTVSTSVSAKHSPLASTSTRHAGASHGVAVAPPSGFDPARDVFLVSAADDAATSDADAVARPVAREATPNYPTLDAVSMTRPRRVGKPTDDAPVRAADAVRPALETFRANSAGATHHGEPVVLQSPLRGGRITSRFGTRTDPFNRHSKFHSGVDIAAPRGTPIGAAAAGVVVFAGRSKGYGNTVVIEHADGRRTRYAHAEQLYVSPGDTVRSGEQIAAVGSTGRSTGPHLHFEVIEGGRQREPLSRLVNDMMLARR